MNFLKTSIIAWIVIFSVCTNINAMNRQEDLRVALLQRIFHQKYTAIFDEFGKTAIHELIDDLESDFTREVVSQQILFYFNTDPEIALLCNKFGMMPLVAYTVMNYAGNYWIDQIIKMLVYAGSDVNGGDSVGRTALHFAAQANDADCAKLLITLGANVNAATFNMNLTPLHIACISGNKEIFDVLISANANCSATDANGLNPLDYAIKNGHHKLFGKLSMRIKPRFKTNCHHSAI